MRAAGYIRVSTEEQAKHGWNLDEDRHRIEQIAEANGWDLIAVHDDGGRQGDDPDRPGFNRMLDTLAECDVIVMRSLDRLSRDTFLYALATRAIRAAGVTIHTFNGPVDLDTPEGELSANILAAIARFEKRQIGARVKQASAARARAGRHAGRRAYGYRWLDGTLVVDPLEACVVERIFFDTVNGVSQRALARQLIEEGVPTMTGRPWGQGTVSKILANPMYAGKIRHNGEVFDGAHERIITEELWDQAALIRASAVRRKGGRLPKGTHLLTKGLLRCGQCGYAMTPRGPDPTRHGYEAYECHGRRTRGLEFCDQRTVRRHVIDEALLADLTRHYVDLDETRRQIEARAAADLMRAREALEQAERDVRRAEERIGRVQRAFQDGFLEPADYAQQRQDLLTERDAALAAVQRAQEHVRRAEETGALADAEEALLRHLAALKAAVSDGVERAPDLNALRTILRELFDSFELIRFPGFGSGANVGGFIPPHDNPVIEDRGEMLALVPHLRWEAVDRDFSVRKASLPGPIEENHFTM